MNGSTTSAALNRLRGAVGPGHVLTEGDLSAYERDQRKRWHGRALAIVRPGCVEEVAAVLRICHDLTLGVVPQGGNTGLVGGSVPDDSGRQVLLSLRRLNAVRQLDVPNLTMTVEAGCVLQTAQQAAAQGGLLLPLSLAAEGSCTVGGNLASNAGGTQVLRYGNARELCLGLEVVTPAGEIWNGLTGLRKDNTGYDLRHLYIGSEGTLGVITAAVLRLYPQPAAQLTALASCQSPRAALALLQRARAHADATLTAFEVMNAHALSLVHLHHPTLPQPVAPGPWTVLLEVSDAQGAEHANLLLEALLEAALQAGEIDDAAVAQSVAQSQAMWRLRETIPLAQAAEGLNVKHDISLPVSRVPDFIDDARAAIDRHWPGARLVTFGHLGDGNLHYNVQAPEGTAAPEFLRTQEAALNEVVFDLVARHGGSFSAEHGIGVLKRETLAQRKSPVALALMRSIKQALDPLGIMNPGRLL